MQSQFRTNQTGMHLDYEIWFCITIEGSRFVMINIEIITVVLLIIIDFIKSDKNNIKYIIVKDESRSIKS